MSRQRFRLAGASTTALIILGVAVCSIVGDEPKPASPAQSPAPSAAGAASDNKDTENGSAPQQHAAPADARAAERAAQLVQRLGADSFEERSEAADELARLGLSAREALLQGLNASDLEVKRSCRRILADVLEADYERRLQAFINDKDGTGQHELPGWERYREMVGSDQAARELFVEMHRAEGALLETYESGEQAVAFALQTRFAQITSALHGRFNNKQHKPSRGTVAALLFVSTDPEMDIPNDVKENAYWQSIIQLSPLQQTLSASADTPERKLFGAWLLMPGSPSLLQRKLTMAMQYGSPEGLKLAIRTAERKDGNPAIYRAMGAAGIGQLGGKKYASLLLPMLKDETVCSQRSMRRKGGQNRLMKLELRDVALAWLVHLTGQSQADYGRPGIAQLFKRMKQYPQNALQVNNLFFNSPEDREAAFAKWEKWYADHPLPAAPPQNANQADENKDDEVGKNDKPGAPKQGAAAAKQRRVANGAAAVRGAPFLAAGAIAAAQRAAMAAAAQVAAAKAGADEDASDDENKVHLERADRQDVQQVVRAGRLIEDGYFTDAADMLGRVLESEKDYTYQPDRGVPLQRGLKVEAERLLGGMPEKGLQAYRDAFGASAAALLEQAVAVGDEQLLIDVMRRYFHTRSGAEATYLLGTHYMNSGQALRAAFCLDRLRRQSHDHAEFEPALSVKLAVCLGQVGLSRQAEQVLVELKATQQVANVDLAGVRHDLFAERAQAVSWLHDVTHTAAGDVAETGWPMYRGNAARNQAVENGNPYLRAPLLSPVIEDNFVRGKAAAIQREMIDGYQAQLPSLHPLVVGDTILVRSATSVRALDFESGELRWEAPLVDALRHLVEHHDDDTKRQYADFVERGLRLRLWEDATFGSMSSDGRLVFGIEETPFGLGGDYRRLVVMPDGRRRLDPGTQKNYNLLTAYDVKTGKIRWEAGGMPGASSAPLAGAYFLGPPLPMGGRLYAVAELDEEVRLIELEANTGQPLWQLGLADRTTQQLDPNQAMMLIQMGLQPPKRLAHTAGASPSSSKGVLVCPLSENEYAAVDLTTRSVIWLYTTQQDDLASSLRMGLNIAVQKRMLEAARDADDRWGDSSVTIADDAVLLTPQESNRIFCLGLGDGNLRWTAPRLDGFYVAGVQDGRVVIVGRGNLRAINLSDGRPAWDEAQIPLPPAAVPSGRGFLGEGRYFLPLSSGEVAQFDLSDGRLVSRSRAADAVVPGNLVEYRGMVLSQSVDGLRRFETLNGRLKTLERALTERGDEPQLLADLGETLLYSGRVVEALDHLTKAHRLQPTPRTSGLLARGLIEAMRIDYDRFAELSREFEPHKDAPEYAWFHKERALALQQAGRLDDAFADLLRLIDTMPDPGKMVRVEFHREVSNRRWIAARFDELRSEAGDVQREVIDRLLADAQEKLPPREFLTYFSRHPLADEARLKLVRDESGKTSGSGSAGSGDKAAQTERLLVEMQLWRLLESDESARRGEAVARLMQRYRAENRSLEAAPLVTALERQFADIACLDGRTGRQLAAAIPAEAPVRRDPGGYWPAAHVETKSNGTVRGMNYTYPVNVCSLGGPFATELSIEIDQSGRQITALDALGRKRIDYTVPQNSPNYIGGAMFSYSRAFVIGNYAVVWMGNRVCAFDVSQPKGRLLWSKDTFDMQQAAQRPAIAMMFMRLRMPRQVNGLPGGDPVPLALSGDAVFFQNMDRLLAVDLLSGQLLWSRDGIAESSDLLADGDHLFVQQPGEDEALVFSTLDGRSLGRRDLGDASRRLAAYDGRLLEWSDDPAGKALQLRSAWTGETAWRKTFSAAALPWPISPEQVAVLDGDRLEIVDARTGAVRLTATLAVAHKSDSIFVTPSLEGYLVAVNRPDGKKANAFGQTLAMTSAEVHGTLFGLDARGAVRWKFETRDQMLRLNQPRLLPVVTLLNEIYERRGNRTHRYYEMICLDRRSGDELFRKKEDNKSNRQIQYDADLQKHTLQLRSQAGTVNFTFSEKKPS